MTDEQAQRFRKRPVGDLMLNYLAAEGAVSVCSNDGLMAQVGRECDLPLWKGMNPHPLNYGRLATARLSSDPRFVAGLIRATDCDGRERLLKCFWIRGHEPDRLKATNNDR